MTHLISYYITIILIISVLYHENIYVTVCVGLHKLSLCVGCAPWKSCSRTIDDEILARPVKDTDLLLLGSAHLVPMEDCFRRWQSMARRVSNSLVQWAHLKPRACGAFLTGRLSWPVGRITWKQGTSQGISLQGPVIFLGKQAGWCREETCSENLRINDKQSICSVMRIARAASVTELCLSHGKCDNLLQNRQHVSVDMTTWKGIQHTIQNILRNNKKWLYVSSMTSWVMPGNARRHAHFPLAEELLN